MARTKQTTRQKGKKEKTIPKLKQAARKSTKGKEVFVPETPEDYQRYLEMFISDKEKE